MVAHSHRVLFADRVDAGRKLAKRLEVCSGRPDVLVLGLPRGGVPVAAEVALRLGAPLDLLLVRKLGAPSQEEFAMGAVASGGAVEWDDEVLEQLRIPESTLREIVHRELTELARRETLYRQGRAALDVRGRVVILVDDGLATGSTMHAAVSAIQRKSPARIVVAVPVASRSACAELAAHADGCVCVAQPSPFHAVGMWYSNFEQTTDEEVIACLERCAHLPVRVQGNAEG